MVCNHLPHLSRTVKLKVNEASFREFLRRSTDKYKDALGTRTCVSTSALTKHSIQEITLPEETEKVTPELLTMNFFFAPTLSLKQETRVKQPSAMTMKSMKTDSPPLSVMLAELLETETLWKFLFFCDLRKVHQ